MTDHSENRSKKYHEISSQLARLDDAQLRALIERSAAINSSTGWGASGTVLVGQTKVFVKQLLVTSLEYDNLLSTANFYQLPTYCNYGLGSPGFGVFRELVTHLKTTHWVLRGETAHFPLMYHYRLLPFIGTRAELNNETHHTLVRSWGNNANLNRYILDRSQANHTLILFLEYIPYVLESWLRENPHTLQKIWPDIAATIAFLRKKEIVHFDAHFGNILSDGEQIYLSDFGLALDKNFALTRNEVRFLERHQHYDYGEILRNLGRIVFWSYDACSQADRQSINEKYRIQSGLQNHEIGSVLLDNIAQLHGDGVMNLDEFYVDFVVKHRRVIALMQDFFSTMWSNNDKNTPFPHLKLQRWLEESEFFPDVEFNSAIQSSP